MRRLVAITLLSGCSVFAPPPAAVTPPTTPPPTTERFGLSVDEEAQILRLEDRREFDAEIVSDWLHRTNPTHRSRMALALGRIGSQTFIDTNGNGQRDAGEHQAGVDALSALVHDADANVRATAAFALGQIGDVAATDALLQFVRDPDGDVGGEAVEAMSKLAPRLPLASYAPWTNDPRVGIRASAIRFLFRFRSDEAMAIAASALESPIPAVRREAAYALSRRAYAPARQRLELLLTDPDDLTRAHVARALGGIASPESLTPLFNALLDPQPWLRTNALGAITKIAAKTPAAIERPTLTRDVLRIVGLSDDPDPGTRATAIDTVGPYAVSNDVARKRLLEIAANGSRWDRELAAGAIAKWIGDETLLPSDMTDWAKVRVLTNGGAVADRLRAAYAKDPSAMVRFNAINTIPDDRVDAELPLIRAALDDPDAVARGYALDRLGHSTAPDKATIFAEAEKRARGDKQNDARLAAIRGIADEATLRGFLTDADPVVRRLAADILEQNLGKPRPQFTPLPIERPAAEYAQIVEWSRQPHTARIRMPRGNVDVTLTCQAAPMTTWNFAQLAQRGYFAGTTFMRVVPNFVVQGGDPRNDQEGGPGYAIRDEINLQKYTRGAVGMALSGPDTGGSQFFITHSPQPHLDGGYTIFGYVSGGMAAVVDQIERGDRVDGIDIDVK